MQLDSVRELKSNIATRLLPRMATAMRAFTLPGEAAQAIDRAAPAAPTVALGVTPKRGGGFALAVRVQQRAVQQSREIELIVKQAKGEVDVRYIGTVFKLAAPWRQQRHRPLRIGTSIGHHKITAGTLGCFVRPRGGGALAALSNNHVLANENRAKAGDVILQPGAADGGILANDPVATLTKFVRVQKSGRNLVDAAYATLAEGIEAETRSLQGFGKLKGLGSEFIDEGAKVAKLGRTTGLTRGRVTAFELDGVTVTFDAGDLVFDNQIEIEGADTVSFSEGGDSGSLIVDEGGLAVALLFAGGDQGGANGQGLTYGNPIRTVLDKLGAELAL